MLRIYKTLVLVLLLGSASAQIPNCNLVASFTTIPANTPNLFYFQNTSTGLVTTDSIRWSFGDGTFANTLNAYHTYIQSGSYNVCLRIIHRDATGTLTNCISEVCHSITIPPTTTCTLAVHFTANQTTVVNTWHFENTSVPINTTDSIYWTFGDGTNSNASNPTHTYQQAGSYTVCLIIRQRTSSGDLTGCANYSCQNIIVQSTVCNLIAGFTSTIQTNTLYSYHFQNTTTGLAATDSVHWSFGDGTASTDVSPNHTYTAAGTYIVCLRVQHRDANGALTNCISEICHTIVIQAVCSLVVNFTATQTSALNTWHFENTSVPVNTTDSIYWTFGDGTNSNVPNPTHTYSQSGTYNVCLIIRQRDAAGTLTGCVRYTCHNIIIPPTCNLSASFTTAQITSAPNTFHFQNTTGGLATTDSVRWYFGDGTFSTDVSPNHTYAAAGTYTVCLRVQHRDANGVLTNCISDVCHTITIPVTCNLIAGFTALTSTTIANTYYFQNTTAGLATSDSVHWNFGDGESSTLTNPTHTYLHSGTYTVCLRVQHRDANGSLTNCVSEICHQVVVQTPCTLAVHFTATQTSATNTWHFENTSVPINANDSIYWTFGDGTHSGDLNPNHTYAQPGTYTVCLIVRQRAASGDLSGCANYSCQPVVVPNICDLHANFTFTSGTTPFTFHFQNTTSGLAPNDSIRWTFGDGATSNAINPDHTYTHDGTFNVCLRVQHRNPNGVLTNCVSEICHTVTIVAPCTLIAHYSYTADPANPLVIHFNNLTVSPTTGATAFWSFGDGQTSTAWNPVHPYSLPGRYRVCLRVAISNTCVSYACDSITVYPPPVSCTQQSHFSYTASPTTPAAFTFTPLSVSSDIQYTWTFGDGTGSHDPVATHVYNTTGTYTVCLTAFRNPGCASTTCRTITAGPAFCNGAMVSFNYQADTYIPNKIYFTAISNTPLADQVWTITKLPASTTTPPVSLHQNNPSFVFTDTGYYNVCLRAVTTGGCVKEYCRIIHIEHVVITPGTCTLPLYPNPVTDVVNVTLNLNADQMIDAYIYNNMAVLVREKHQAGFTGNNTVSINVGDLPAGSYTIRVVHGNDVCYAQFIKL